MLEEAFLSALLEFGHKPQREHKFFPGRRWRFDFAYPERKIAFEIEGGLFSARGGGHSGAGLNKDCIKYNAATMKGWSVYRFTTKDFRVRNGQTELKEYGRGVVQCVLNMKSQAMVDLESKMSSTISNLFALERTKSRSRRLATTVRESRKRHTGAGAGSLLMA